AAQEDAFLYVDEAHATGVYGPQGRGLAAACGVEPDIAMGTLSKALGCVGAFVAGRKVLCDLLRNRARSYVFTTSMPPAMAAAAVAAIRRSEAADERRARLWGNTQHFRRELTALGIALPPGSRAPIVPLHVGEATRTVAASQALLSQGIFAHG